MDNSLIINIQEPTDEEILLDDSGLTAMARVAFALQPLYKAARDFVFSVDAYQPVNVLGHLIEFEKAVAHFDELVDAEALFSLFIDVSDEPVVKP